MKAIIMAGGKGTRLLPLTYELPKPMVPVMNIPLMEYIILLLKEHGIEDIGVTLMYLPQKIKRYFGDGSQWGVHLSYFTEDSPLGTAGSILKSASFLDDTFVVISGDCMTDINLTEAIAFHQNKKAIATIVLTGSDNPVNFGIVTTDNCNFVTGFLEKPTRSEIFTDTINTGIYVLEPEILKYIEPNRPFDFSRDLFPRLLDAGLPLAGYTMDQYWSDVGSLESYMDTHRDILDRKYRKPFQKRRPGNISIGKDTVIEPTAIINEPCFIGSNCYIGHEAVIGSYTVIGDNCIIDNQASLIRSILMNHCTVGSGSELRGSILGNKVRLMHNVSTYENTVIGDDSIIHERSIVKPNIKIWPGKIVDTLSIVDRNIVWAARYNPSLFHNSSISGIINVDITPEFSSRLGSAYGSILGQGKSVVVSSDMSRSSVLFQYAFMSGLMSVGVQGYHLNGIPTPLSRQAVHMLHVAGGVHIRRSIGTDEKVEIHFMDALGANTDSIFEKNVENAFYKEDFLRCRVNAIKDIIHVNDFTALYVRYLQDRIDPKVIADNPPTLFVMSNCEAMLAYIHDIFKQLHIPIAGEMLVNHFDPNKRMNVEHFLRADLTAYIDCSGEKLVLMDSSGRVIDENHTFLLYAYILYKTVPGLEIVAPYNVTGALERLAKKYGGSVMWTKISQCAVLKELMTTDVYSEPVNQYMFMYDAIASLAKVVEFLSLNRTTLDNLLKFIPSCYLEHNSFICSFESIGRVMRILLSENNTEKQLCGGIKMSLNHSWVLIIPDEQKPLIHLYVEGNCGREASRLLNEYSSEIQTLIAKA